MNLISRICWWFGWYSPSTQPLWHVHHDHVVGTWRGGVDDRHNFISRSKPESQQAIRHRLLKPVKGRLPMSVVANLQTGEPWYYNLEGADMAAVRALHAAECAPDCPMLHGADSICPTA